MSVQIKDRVESRIDPDEIVRRVRSVLPKSESKVALHEPRFTGNERAYLND